MKGRYRDTVSRETVERLEIFVDLFTQWSARINLIAPSTREQIWTRHIADSLQIFELHSTPAHWVDLGSGGGFPGAILAIALAETGEGWVDLVESNQKKASFLRMALRETGARGTVHAARIEDVRAQIHDVNCVSARALADLDLLFELSELWFQRDNARGWFHKGRDYRAEIAKARGRWKFDLVEHRSTTNSESAVLEVSNLGRL
jgi:16S rRNA (guanine527-N7)-methyltransferase